MALQSMNRSAVFRIFPVIVVLRIDKINLMSVIISYPLIKSGSAAQQLDYPFRYLETQCNPHFLLFLMANLLSS